MERLYTRRKILSVYSLAEISHREHFSGIIDFLAHHSDCGLSVADPLRIKAGIDSYDVAAYDGFIVSLDCGPAFMTTLVESEKPTVLVNIDGLYLSNRKCISCVWLDNAAIGRTAARHFRETGKFASFGFVPDEDGQFYNKERATAFTNEIIRCQPSATIHKYDGVENLSTWLSSLPKPAALMSADSSAAYRVLVACRDAGIAIPRDIALITVDPDAKLSESAKPTISSIIPNFRKMGYMAAKELVRLMNSGKKAPFHEIVVSDMSVLSRESTRPSHHSGDLASLAVRYVRSHANSPLTATSVAHMMRCSRRLLDMRMKEATGRTLRETIIEERLSRAEALLARGLSVNEVARRLRFTTANHLSRVFAKHRNKTICEWRNATELEPLFSHSLSASRARKND